MTMSVFSARQRDLTWQDRTMNIEVMMAPTRAQLLFNKHKGLNTKYRQESSNLEREKISYLRSFRTEVRLMERRKDLYAKRKIDIQTRKDSADSRRRSVSTDGGRKSAPPRLERESSKGENSSIFLTQLDLRDSKSAEPGISTDTFRTFQPHTQTMSRLTSANNRATPITSGWSTPTPVVGKPFLKLERQKSVRFQKIQLDGKDNTKQENKEPAPLTLEDKIKNFMQAQKDFNMRETRSAPRSRSSGHGFSDFARRRSSVGQSSSLIKLENAFDNFCSDKSPEKFSKLVKYATKMRENFKNSRSMSIIPDTFPATDIPIITT